MPASRVSPILRPISAAAIGETSGPSFGELLKNAVGAVVEAGRKSDAQTQAMAAGKANIVDVVTAVAETEVAVEALVAVRDRMITGLRGNHADADLVFARDERKAVAVGMATEQERRNDNDRAGSSRCGARRHPDAGAGGEPADADRARGRRRHLAVPGADADPGNDAGLRAEDSRDLRRHAGRAAVHGGSLQGHMARLAARIVAIGLHESASAAPAQAGHSRRGSQYDGCASHENRRLVPAGLCRRLHAGVRAHRHHGDAAAGARRDERAAAGAADGRAGARRGAAAAASQRLSGRPAHVRAGARACSARKSSSARCSASPRG